jgi:hypothetical protein
MANNQIIISRIQNRRGLKENLPQPLLPGEIALTVDTGELWIGSDPDQPPFGVRTYSSGGGDISTAESIVDTQIVSAKFDNTFDEADFEALVTYLTGGPPSGAVLTEDDILWDGLVTIFIAADISVDAANTINNILDDIADPTPTTGSPVAGIFDSANSGALGSLNDPYIEIAVSGTLEFTAPDTITRSTGSFVADQYFDGQKIVIADTANNNGTYTIAAGGVAGSTLTVEEAITTEAAITITAGMLRGRTNPLLTDAFDSVDGDFQFGSITVQSNAAQGANAAILINEINGAGLVTTFGNLQITTSGIGVGSPTFRDMTVVDVDSGYTWMSTGTASADSTTDELTFVSGNNIDIDVDTVNDAIRITSVTDADPDTIYTGFTDSPTGNNVATEAVLANGTTAFADVPNVIFDIDGDSDVIFIEYSLNSGANIAGSDNYVAVGNMRLLASNNTDAPQANLLDDRTVIKDSAYTPTPGSEIEFEAVYVAAPVTSSATSIQFVAGAPATILYDAGGSDFVTDGFTNGMEITVDGSQIGNNGVYTINTVSAGTITLIPGETLVNETVDASLSSRNQVKIRYKNGYSSNMLLRFVTRRWMSYDYANTPVPPPFLMVLGVFAPADEGNAYGSQYISSTGIDTWTETPAIAPLNPGFYRPSALAYKAANNTFVAGSESSTSAIHAYSTNDGTSWTVATRVDFMTSFGVAYNPTADRWVSVGNSGKAQYSDNDGVTWVSGATQPAGNLRDVIWSPTNNLWFCCNLDNAVYSSSDGTNWSLTATEPGGASSNDLLTLWTVGNRLFAGSGTISGTGGVIYYSDDDGATWSTPATMATLTTSSEVTSMGYDGSSVLMACSQLNNNDSLWRSTDNGVNWTAEATGIAGTQNYADIKYDSSANVWILAGGVQNTASKIWTSPSGLNGTWTEQENGTGTDGFGQILEVIGGKTIVIPT